MSGYSARLITGFWNSNQRLTYEERADFIDVAEYLFNSENPKILSFMFDSHTATQATASNPPKIIKYTADFRHEISASGKDHIHPILQITYKNKYFYKVDYDKLNDFIYTVLGYCGCWRLGDKQDIVEGWKLYMNKDTLSQSKRSKNFDSQLLKTFRG